MEAPEEAVSGSLGDASPAGLGMASASEPPAQPIRRANSLPMMLAPTGHQADAGSESDGIKSADEDVGLLGLTAPSRRMSTDQTRTATPSNASTDSGDSGFRDLQDLVSPEDRRGFGRSVTDGACLLRKAHPDLHIMTELKKSSSRKSLGSRSSSKRTATDFWDNDDDANSIGAPGPRWHPGDTDLSPEKLEQRSLAMQRVAKMSAQWREELKAQSTILRRNSRRCRTTAAVLSSASLPRPGQLAAPHRIALPTDIEPASPTPASPSAPAILEATEEEVKGDEEEDESAKPIVFLDWDDTLLPTWYITDVVCPSLGKTPANAEVTEDSPFWEPLANHARVVEEVLNNATKVARVGIVTLAMRPWVPTSAQKYLPGLDIEAILEQHNIPVYYAREHVCKTHVRQGKLEEGCDLFVIAKRNAMRRCLKKLCGKDRCRNVLSIGDSLTEHEALKELMWSHDDDLLCKTLKLIPEPSLEHLMNELQVLSAHLENLVKHPEDFDFHLAEISELEKLADLLRSGGGN